MSKNNALDQLESKLQDGATVEPNNRKFETFEEEEKKSSQESEKSNKTAGDINLAIGQAENEGQSLDSSSLLRFNRSTVGDPNNETMSNSFGASNRLNRLNGIGGMRQSLSRSQNDANGYFGGLSSTLRNQHNNRSTNFTGNLSLARPGQPQYFNRYDNIRSSNSNSNEGPTSLSTAGIQRQSRT